MEAVIGVVVCFFAIYGVFSILYDCIERASKPKKTADISVHRVLFTGRDMGSAEAYLRSAVLNDDPTDTIVINCFNENEWENECKNEEEEGRKLSLLTSQFDFADCMTVKEYTAFVGKEAELMKHRGHV